MNDNENRKIRIAYAEDERWFRDSIVKLLINSGFEIPILAGDGTEILKFLDSSTEWPDIFLSDLRMPNMHGLQLTTEIIKRWPGAKVVIFSSEVERFYIEEAKKAGATAFLHMIIHHKHLVETLVEIHESGTTSHGSFKKLED